MCEKPWHISQLLSPQPNTQPIHCWSLMTTLLTSMGEGLRVLWTIRVVPWIWQRITQDLELLVVIPSIVVATQKKTQSNHFNIPLTTNSSLTDLFIPKYTQVLLTISTSPTWLTWWQPGTTTLSVLLATHVPPPPHQRVVASLPPDWKHKKTRGVHIYMLTSTNATHNSMHNSHIT